MIEPLPASSLRRTFSLDDFHFTSTRQLLAYRGIVGQERAVTALDFGLEIDAHGFNIFVAGPEGIGKMTATLAFLEERVAKRKTPSDWCYVNNFEDPDHPRPIALPAGEGRRFQREMRTIEENLRVELPKAFEREEYAKKREEIVKRHAREREALVETLNRKAREANFLLQSTPYGLMLIPLKEGRPLPEEAFRQLPEAEQTAIQEKRRELEGETQRVLKEIYRIEQRILEDLQRLDEQIARYIVGIWIDDLEEKYAHLPEVLAFLKAVENDIVANVATLKAPPKQNGEGKREGTPIAPPWSEDLPYRKYRVNLLVDHSDQKGAPVIVEENPTYLNLFGRIEKETHLGAIYTDFTMIKSGALHRANGGYLVIPVENLLRSPFSWPALKRALRSRAVRIEEPAELMGFSTVKSLSPDPIPLDLKIILVGPSLYYHLLYRFDADFGELFKVKADFDTRMENTSDNIREFLGFLCAFCEKQGLRHLDRKGVVRLLEFAAREADDQEKLSTHFGKLSDLLQEADYWARKANAKLIRASHIERAISEHRFRSGLLQDRIQEAIVRGTYLIDTRGSAVGQINGLAVYQAGDYRFGRPNRITATVSPGRGNIVDIEREAKLGGALHSKGVMILAGFLMDRFAAKRPLNLSARLVFEQNYAPIDGDSASSTELYALLSALSDLPIDQGIAVTGSVNQHGKIQAIGGVNQKIEGFFDLCKARRLTGKQGVVIPKSNVKNLMLRKDVVQAVKRGRFHVWAVETVEEGIEILTGVAAGKPDQEGNYPKDSVYGRVVERLTRFSEALKSTSKPNNDKPNGK